MSTTHAKALALCSLWVSSCGGETEEHGSALLVTLDTTNARALSCYGGPEGLTPRLDALAEEGVRFLAARAVAPITAPSHASMLTGLYPVRHALRMNASLRLPAAARTLAEVVSERGVRTGAFVAAVVLDAEFGLDQGFEVYGAVPATGKRPASHRRGAEVVDEALAWLETVEPGAPFFLWTHFFDAHYPYEPFPSFLERAGGDPYLGEVSYTDQQVGRLLDGIDGLGHMRALTVLVTADHGEGLGLNGEETHGTLLFDATLHVPMILRYPDGHGAGSTVAACVSGVDVFPTLLNAMGFGDVGDIDGESLYRRMPDPERGVYFESYFGFTAYGWSHMSGWAGPNGKYLHSSAPLFRATPPGILMEERASFVAAEPHDHARELEPMRRMLARDVLEHVGLGGEGATLAENIEKLGYAGASSGVGSFPGPLDASDRPSPNERIELHAEFNRANVLIESGQPRRALPILRSVTKEDPSNPTAWNELGKVLLGLGHHASAVEAFTQALATRGEDWVEPWLNIGLCHELLGDETKTIEAWLQAFRNDVGPLPVLEKLIGLLDEAGREEEAREKRALLEKIRAEEAGS